MFPQLKIRTDILMSMFSVFDLLLIAVGIGIIWKIYLSNTMQERFNIKSFRDLELMKSELVKNQNIEKSHRLIAILASVLWLLIISNYGEDFVPGWILLGAVGISIALSNYLLADLKMRHIFGNTSLSSEDASIQLRRVKAKNETTKSISITLIVTAVLCFNWSYQVQKNTREEQELATSIASRVSGQGWCGNFADIDVFDGGETVVKKGGWPCVYVGSVDSISFKESDGDKNMCFYASFNVENGFPGEEVFKINSDFNEFCIEESDFGGWSEYAIEDAIGEYVRPGLKNLTAELCRAYGFRMSYEAYSLYCS